MSTTILQDLRNRNFLNYEILSFSNLEEEIKLNTGHRSVLISISRGANACVFAIQSLDKSCCYP